MLRNTFQCSSASRKFLICVAAVHLATQRHVSVLFSEPKIPHRRIRTSAADQPATFQCSSASRKFLTDVHPLLPTLPHPFQCSSASRKFLIKRTLQIADAPRRFQCSSASRKFLNLPGREQGAGLNGRFQCSSASRKFLNKKTARAFFAAVTRFSALQRAENSSIDEDRTDERAFYVSVLFSEPKIPHEKDFGYIGGCRIRFSALQRAENSSTDPRTCVHPYFRPR